MRITLEIPDELLYAALFHETTAKAAPIEEKQWIIDDPWTRRLLRHYGFSCRSIGTCWYATNCPIAFNGRYRLPDGNVLVSDGTTLRWQRVQ